MPKCNHLLVILVAILSLVLPKTPQAIAEEASLQQILSVQYQGGVRLTITDSQGRSSGLNPETQQIQYDIPNSQVTFGADQGGIVLTTPTDGSYTVQIHGIYDEDYQIEINYSNSNEKVEVHRLHGFHHTNSQASPSFVTTLNQNDSKTPITFSYTSPIPQNLLLQPTGDVELRTKLTWDASTDPAVTGYNTYYYNGDKPFFQFLAETTDNFYQTEQPWASAESTANTSYAVTTVKADGSESFFSSIETNDDRDSDWLTDSEETAIGTALDNPDTDGDQLTDYQEHVKYGTDPLRPDTDGDTFTDYIEIQKGSDPLDANSIPPVQVYPENGRAESETYTIDPDGEGLELSGVYSAMDAEKNEGLTGMDYNADLEHKKPFLFGIKRFLPNVFQTVFDKEQAQRIQGIATGGEQVHSGIYQKIFITIGSLIFIIMVLFLLAKFRNTPNR